MSETTLKTIIKLRRNTQSYYENLGPDFVPLNGEMCWIDTDKNGLRYKIGDGVTKYSKLPYVDSYVIQGYYYNGEFYTSTTHTEKYVGYSHKIYIDITEVDKSVIYIYNGEEYTPISYIPEPASETVPGVMKLYKNGGTNEDGTMTQKSITQGVQSIHFAVDAEDAELLTLDLPWD